MKIGQTGKSEDVVLLAFNEPPEYQPTDRWFTQFQDKDPSPHLAPGREIVGILGSTLSTHAISDGVRLALTLFAEKMQRS